MPRKTRGPVGHSGRTGAGNTRDIKVERIDAVTIYKRGLTYYLYYREDGASERRKVDGNLAVARATASKVAAALAEKRPSPIGYQRTDPKQAIAGFLDYITNVQRLALRTQDRYRAALERFHDFCGDAGIVTIDSVSQATVEDFVKWLRGRTRARNGSRTGKKDVYKLGGIKFILSTCRTAFNWAAQRRMLPPFTDNPFTLFPIDQLRDPGEADAEPRIFTPTQERAFFNACSEWQRGIFLTLAAYGLRVGELTHLLIEDVDLVEDKIEIRSKPDLFWNVKTGRRRQLPLTAEMKPLIDRLIGERKAGLVFLNEAFVAENPRPLPSFATPAAFRAHVQKVVADLVAEKPEATEREKRRATRRFGRSMGQIPERRVRGEFMKLTKGIGCPQFTRAHDLRHLFSSRAQERGLNPLLVQEILGHTTLEMTKKYTHIGLESKREALGKIGIGQGPASEPS